MADRLAGSRPVRESGARPVRVRCPLPPASLSGTGSRRPGAHQNSALCCEEVKNIYTKYLYDMLGFSLLFNLYWRNAYD